MVQSTPFKYWETRGIKDVTSYTGGGGVDRWSLTEEDYDAGRWSGADWAFRMVTGVSTIHKPKDPTSASSYFGVPTRVQILSGGAWQTKDVPETWYDCTTWEDYTVCTYDYQAVKSKAGTPSTETKTFLVQTGGIAAAQNLAFDMDDYDNNDWEA